MPAKFQVRNVLAATDLTESNLPALRYARLFGDRFGAHVTIVYCDPIVYPVSSPEALFIAPPPEHYQELRAQVARHVAEVMAGRPYEVVVTTGDAIPAILETAEERSADLVVMGSHCRHGWRRALIGSISSGVLHGSHCPVLTVATQVAPGPSRPLEVTKVLCPVNFSDVARDALRAASRIAEIFSAELVVVHVAEPGEATAVDEQTVRRWVAPELQAVCSFHELLVRGTAAERVLDCADDAGADLLVIGAQHKLFRDATIIGTTSERLIRFSSCPVLVVPRQPVAIAAEVHREREAVAQH